MQHELFINDSTMAAPSAGKMKDRAAATPGFSFFARKIPRWSHPDLSELRHLEVHFANTPFIPSDFSDFLFKSNCRDRKVTHTYK